MNLDHAELLQVDTAITGLPNTKYGRKLTGNVNNNLISLVIHFIYVNSNCTSNKRSLLFILFHELEAYLLFAVYATIRVISEHLNATGKWKRD